MIINRAVHTPFMNRDYHNAFCLLLTTVVACCLLYKLRAAAFKKITAAYVLGGNGSLLLHFIRAVVTKRNGKGLRNTDVRFCNVVYMLLAEEYQ